MELFNFKLMVLIKLRLPKLWLLIADNLSRIPLRLSRRLPTTKQLLHEGILLSNNSLLNSLFTVFRPVARSIIPILLERLNWLLNAYPGTVVFSFGEELPHILNLILRGTNIVAGFNEVAKLSILDIIALPSPLSVTIIQNGWLITAADSLEIPNHISLPLLRVPCLWRCGKDLRLRDVTLVH
jgi:hypothetical protein